MKISQVDFSLGGKGAELAFGLVVLPCSFGCYVSFSLSTNLSPFFLFKGKLEHDHMAPISVKTFLRAWRASGMAVSDELLARSPVRPLVGLANNGQRDTFCTMVREIRKSMKKGVNRAGLCVSSVTSSFVSNIDVARLRLNQYSEQIHFAQADRESVVYPPPFLESSCCAIFRSLFLIRT